MLLCRGLCPDVGSCPWQWTSASAVGTTSHRRSCSLPFAAGSPLAGSWDCTLRRRATPGHALGACREVRRCFARRAQCSGFRAWRRMTWRRSALATPPCGPQFPSPPLASHSACPSALRILPRVFSGWRPPCSGLHAAKESSSRAQTSVPSAHRGARGPAFCTLAWRQASSFECVIVVAVSVGSRTSPIRFCQASAAPAPSGRRLQKHTPPASPLLSPAPFVEQISTDVESTFGK